MNALFRTGDYLAKYCSAKTTELVSRLRMNSPHEYIEDAPSQADIAKVEEWKKEAEEQHREQIKAAK